MGSDGASPFLVRDFLNYVIENKHHYAFNVRRNDHLVIDYKDFYVYACYVRGIELSINEASTLFRLHLPHYLDALVKRGVVREYKVEKTSRAKPARVHIFLNGKTDVEATTDATETREPSLEPKPHVQG